MGFWLKNGWFWVVSVGSGLWGRACTAVAGLGFPNSSPLPTSSSPPARSSPPALSPLLARSPGASGVFGLAASSVLLVFPTPLMSCVPSGLFVAFESVGFVYCPRMLSKGGMQVAVVVTWPLSWSGTRWMRSKNSWLSMRRVCSGAWW